MRRLRAVPIAVLVVLAGAASAFGALSGNSQGIALAHKVLSAFGKINGYHYTEKGYFWMKSEEGRSSYFDYVTGTAKGPSGYVRASENGEVGIKGGKVVWWRDELTPPVSHKAGIAIVPVELVVDKAGKFAAYGTLKSHTCFVKLRGFTPFTVGGHPYYIAGKVSAPQPDGSSQILTYVYPWTKAQTATEHDTVNSTTDLVSVAKVDVAAGGGYGAFRIVTDDSFSGTLSAPKVKLCKS